MKIKVKCPDCSKLNSHEVDFDGASSGTVYHDAVTCEHCKIVFLLKTKMMVEPTAFMIVNPLETKDHAVRRKIKQLLDDLEKAILR